MAEKKKTNQQANEPANKPQGVNQPVVDNTTTPPAGEEQEQEKEEETPEEKPNSEVKDAKKQLEIMKRLGVSKIWRNGKGEYFTNENLAQLSGPKKEVELVTKDRARLVIEKAK